MEEVKQKLSSGEFKTVLNEEKSTVWRYFCLVVQADSNEAVGYVKCKKCNVLMKYDSKRTGNSALQRDVNRGCKTTDDAGGLLQPSITAFATSSTRKIPLQEKKKMTEKCVAFCCKDLRPFRSIEGEGFRELPQQLINVGAVYGPLAVQDGLPDPTIVKTMPQAGDRETQKAGGTTEQHY